MAACIASPVVERSENMIKPLPKSVPSFVREESLTAGRGVSKKVDEAGKTAIAKGTVDEVLNLPRIIYDPVAQKKE